MTNEVCCLCDGPIDPHTTPDGKVYWTLGHNAQPVKEGQCCTKCHDAKVLPLRLSRLQNRQTGQRG